MKVGYGKCAKRNRGDSVTNFTIYFIWKSRWDHEFDTHVQYRNDDDEKHIQNE